MVRVDVRDYRTTDWPAVCRIHDSARPIEVAGFVPKSEVWSMEQAAVVDGFFDSQTFLACLDHAEGTPAGFVSIRGAEICWFYVDPALHRQGIGRKLIEYVLPLLGADGFALCVSENPQAQAFYRSFDS